MTVNGKNGKNKRKRRIIVGSGIAILVVLVFGIAAVFRSNHPIDPSKLAKVERGDIARSVVATGKIEPLTKVEVKSKASGIVKKLYVEAGDRVHAGEVLAELDKDQLASSVKEGEANLRAAQAAVLAAEATAQRMEVEAEGPDIPFLKDNMDRYKELFREGMVAENVMQDAEMNYRLAVNRQAAARRTVASSEAQVAQAKAQVAQARAALDTARENLSYATITSPIDGMVLSRDVEIGGAVSSILVLGSDSTLVMTLGNTSQVFVRGKVDESDIGKVFEGQPARIVVESFKDKTFHGKVTQIAPLGVDKDNVTTFEVKVSIQNPSGELRANMSANAEIILEEKHDLLLIPEGALIYDKDKNTSVEVADPKQENGRRKVDVKIGISNGVKAEVLSGLKEGQEVVLQ
jgi:HlyD family secretion protein